MIAIIWIYVMFRPVAPAKLIVVHHVTYDHGSKAL